MLCVWVNYTIWGLTTPVFAVFFAAFDAGSFATFKGFFKSAFVTVTFSPFALVSVLASFTSVIASFFAAFLASSFATVTAVHYTVPTKTTVSSKHFFILLCIFLRKQGASRASLLFNSYYAGAWKAVTVTGVSLFSCINLPRIFNIFERSSP